MSLQPLWWSLLVASLGLLLYNVTVYSRHRRNSTSLPAHASGNVSGGFGFLLLIVSQLLEMKGALALIALIASFVLMGVSFALLILAKRRAKHVVR